MASENEINNNFTDVLETDADIDLNNTDIERNNRLSLTIIQHFIWSLPRHLFWLLNKKPHHGNNLVHLGHGHGHHGQHYSVSYGGGGLLQLIHQAVKPALAGLINNNSPCGRPICQGNNLKSH